MCGAAQLHVWLWLCELRIQPSSTIRWWAQQSRVTALGELAAFRNCRLHAHCRHLNVNCLPLLDKCKLRVNHTYDKTYLPCSDATEMVTLIGLLCLQSACKEYSHNPSTSMLPCNHFPGTHSVGSCMRCTFFLVLSCLLSFFFCLIVCPTLNICPADCETNQH